MAFCNDRGVMWNSLDNGVSVPAPLMVERSYVRRRIKPEKHYGHGPAVRNCGRDNIGSIKLPQWFPACREPTLFAGGSDSLSRDKYHGAILYIAQTSAIRDLPLLRPSQMPNISQHTDILLNGLLSWIKPINTEAISATSFNRQNGLTGIIQRILFK